MKEKTEPTPAGSSQTLRRLSWRAFTGSVILAALGVWMLIWALSPGVRTRPVQSTAGTLAELLKAVERGDTAAAEAARRLVAEDPKRYARDVARMLQHDSYAVRALACTLAAEWPADVAIPALIPRASDNTWQVRLAAFEAIGKFETGIDAPLRDTRLDEREAILLGIIRRHDGSGTRAALRPRLCELYANLKHVELGKPMIAECMTCHRGDEAAVRPATDNCATCHAEIASDWEQSSHARTVTHFAVRTVDPQARAQVWMTFSPPYGISCTECHRLTEAQQNVETETAARTTCAYNFVPKAAVDSCQRCHEQVDEQWRAWKEGSRPRYADWPPGQIERVVGGAVETCIDCHMPRRQVITADGGAAPGKRMHRWGDHTDASALRGGLAIQWNPATVASGGAASLELSNLAGHDYPTGTRRRALQVLTGAGGQVPMATLVFPPPSPLLEADDIADSLKPGETRRFLLPQQTRSWSEMRLLFIPNRFSPKSTVVDLTPD